MGLFGKHKLFGRSRRSRSMDGGGNAASRMHKCGIEPLESRQLLAADFAPIHIGAVYFEDGSGKDDVGDVIEITFNGGAPGTQLTDLVIDTDKYGDGLTIGDVFFDTEPDAPGAFASGGLQILEQDGIDSVDVSVADGGTQLVFHFQGFEAGEKLVFSIDVDEQGALSPNAVAEGNEFEASKLSATFAADHYYAAEGSDIFLDFYDEKLDGSGLDLPDDGYIPPSPYMPPGAVPGPVYTAGAIFAVEQTPLPITISGNVFEDLDLDNLRDADEPAIGDVTLSLLRLEGDSYAETGRTATTDAQGNYTFRDLLPGTYRIVETQPEPYFSVGAAAGTVDGATRGTVAGTDVITEITLLGGDDSIRNDFGEVLPASIRGRVHADLDGDCTYDPGEKLLDGVTIQLLDADGTILDTTRTDANGEYAFVGLMPSVYGVTEVQPEGYFDSGDRVGSAGGALLGPDSIIDIALGSGVDGVRYDFCEYPPASISGRVHADLNGNCTPDEGEKLLAGVTIELLDASGNVLATTETDANGEYRFENLRPGVYGVREIQPEGYFDGPDHVGSEGGSLLGPDSIIDVELTPGVSGVRYDFCEYPPASISGYVYEDANNNGAFDDGEQPIGGVELVLLDAQGNPTGRTSQTDASGYYRFDGLDAATYGVAETQPESYFDGLDAAGSVGGAAENPGDRITGAVLKPGVHARQYNFGELRPASISGRVHGELNGDCIPDPGEPMLSGVTVHLLDASGNRIATTTTDSQGEYRFTGLRPGAYGVEEIQPEGYLHGRTHPGSAGGSLVEPDKIVDAILGSGVDAVDYNFCEMTPAKISGYVFQDGPTIRLEQDAPTPDPATLRDGRFTADDRPIAGVVLQLGDATGAPLLDGQGLPITAVTDENGYYEFTMLEPGVYTVLQAHPDGYTDSLDTPGTKGGIAVNPSDNVSPLILNQLAVDPRDDAIVRIPVAMGDDAVQYNFSEVVIERVPTESPPEYPLFPREPHPEPPLVPRTQPIASVSPVVMYIPSMPPGRYDLPMGGCGGPGGYTWHLSVINAGHPRRERTAEDGFGNPSNPYFDPRTWTGTDLDQTEWVIANSRGTPVRREQFGIHGSTPIAGDFNGDGIAEIGVFIDGIWLVDLNGNGRFDSDDFWAKLGSPGDLPVVGDWDGDGKADIGVFGPAWIGDHRAVDAEPGLPDAQNLTTGRAKNLPPEPIDAAIGRRMMKPGDGEKLRSDLIDHVFRFGNAGDKPVAGDFNGDGVATIGIFRDGTWFLDMDGDGRWSAADVTAEFGAAGDVPVVGDFNGDGRDEIGVYHGGLWYLDSNANLERDAHDAVFELGGPGDKPAVGDFNGDGVDEIAIQRDRAA